MKRFVFAALVLALVSCSSPQPIVHSLADGVWMRETPLESGLGTNQAWIEIDDFVFIVDSNILDPESEAIAAIRASTPLPMRYLVNTHAHGDHAHGNGHFAAEGVTIIGSNAARDGYERLARDFAGQRERKEHYPAYEKTEWVAPSLWFDSSMTFGEGGRKLELHHLGHGHSPGDVVAWLPEEKILFAGDLVANQHLPYMGDGDVDGWISRLDTLLEWPIERVVPGHGPAGDRSLLEQQRDFLIAFRDEVRTRLNNGSVDPESLSLDAFPLWSEQKPWFRRLAVESYVELLGDGER